MPDGRYQRTIEAEALYFGDLHDYPMVVEWIRSRGFHVDTQDLVIGDLYAGRAPRFLSGHIRVEIDGDMKAFGEGSWVLVTEHGEIELWSNEDFQKAFKPIDGGSNG